MTPKITELTSLTFAVEDLNFIVEQLSIRASFCERLASNLDIENRAEEKQYFAEVGRRCREIARAIALAGQQGIG